MCRPLHGFEGLEVFGTVGSQAPGERDAQSETDDGAKGCLRVDCAGGGLEGISVGFL